MVDITFSTDPLDAADPEPEWFGEIPTDGAVMPEGSDPAAMDAELMTFDEWAGIYAEEPWTLEPVWSLWEEEYA